jgi:anti-sigma regulatory factor (Ser/Thr protein kinase)
MVRRSFESSEESVGAARRFVADRIPDAGAEVRDSVSVMVSELSTNALVHAAGGFEVSVERSDRDVVVSVSDQEDGKPILQSPGPSEPHGRGLRIVDALSDEWGISANAVAGKSVWFRMSLEPSVADGSADGTDGVRVDESAFHGNPSGARRVDPKAPSKDPDSHTPAQRDRGPRRQSRGNSKKSVAPVVPSSW